MGILGPDDADLNALKFFNFDCGLRQQALVPFSCARSA
jgi:hypothetical protein